MSRLSKITHEFLTVTGLPYTVTDAPPLQRRGPAGLKVNFDYRDSFYYPHERQWWKFERMETITLEAVRAPLIPWTSLGIKSTEWPLVLPLMLLSDMLYSCRLNLYPHEPNMLSELPYRTAEEIATLEDFQSRCLRLLQLAIGGRMHLNTKAVTPLARRLLVHHTTPSTDPDKPGVRG